MDPLAIGLFFFFFLFPFIFLSCGHTSSRRPSILASEVRLPRAHILTPTAAPNSDSLELTPFFNAGYCSPLSDANGCALVHI
jgi:hypothetical protein